MKKPKLKVVHVPTLKLYFAYDSKASYPKIISNKLTTIVLWASGNEYDSLTVEEEIYTENIRNKAYECVAYYLANKYKVPMYSSEDTVSRIVEVINDTKAGETEYNSILEVLEDYDVPMNLWWAFMYEVE